MTMTVGDVDVIQLLEFDPDVPCYGYVAETQFHPCDRPADWYMVCRKCGVVAPLCDPDLQLQREAIDADPQCKSTCNRCGSRRQTIDELWDAVPIHRHGGTQ
jgi:hypothetical protein